MLNNDKKSNSFGVNIAKNDMSNRELQLLKNKSFTVHSPSPDATLRVLGRLVMGLL